MSKIILLGASWCPITKQTKELFEKLKAEMDFNYEYIDINSENGRGLVKRFNITDVPKIIYQDKIIFHGLPSENKLLKILNIYE